MSHRPLAWFASLTLCLPFAVAPSTGYACGCFAPPDPAHPVLQAGERILFTSDGNHITAHIQIQYAGDASDFGWLLPLPSVPTLDLGTDELFNQLLATTQPQFNLKNVYPDNCKFQPASDMGYAYGGDLAAFGAFDAGVPMPGGPLVLQDSIGPYDYAVLKADSKQAMLDWLTQNHYFIPAGTDAAVAPYIHPGAYFLALKLKSGQSAGDIQPVVVKYPSDLPMIPITLTAVAAQPNMGIQVWLLGPSRAISRNYHHTVMNDAAIDWNQPGTTYQDLVVRAVAEAPDHHTFITEFAGSSKIMRGVLDYPGRFGNADYLKTVTDAGTYCDYLRANGYPFTGNLVAILQKYIAMPPSLQQQGITPARYYWNLSTYRNIFPQAFQGISLKFDPAALTDEITKKIAKPILDAGKAFVDFPYLTELYTRLSPIDMNADPVFSFNPDLPDVANLRQSTLTWGCNPKSWGYLPSRLDTALGFSLCYPSGTAVAFPAKAAASLRVEVLREQGQPEVLVDNRAAINAALVAEGLSCTVGPGGSGGDMPTLAGRGCYVANAGAPGASRNAALALFGLVGLALAGMSARRRRR